MNISVNRMGFGSWAGHLDEWCWDTHFLTIPVLKIWLISRISALDREERISIRQASSVPAPCRENQLVSKYVCFRICFSHARKCSKPHNHISVANDQRGRAAVCTICFFPSLIWIVMITDSNYSSTNCEVYHMNITVVHKNSSCFFPVLVFASWLK